MNGHSRLGERGSATVEFAVVAVLFLTLLLGIMDFGRMLFTWNAAAEATRWGARVAVVCDKADAGLVLARMQTFLPQLTGANVVISWENPEGVADPGCDPSNCKGVQVSIYNNPANPSDPNNFRIQPISPFMGFLMPPVPAFATYLPRESMQAASPAGDANPVCM
ncbi:MAG TPA: TadE/TadG family type IV pilus assembly protein [Rhodocyclaceae bacterium]